jgi:hypothetical protein
MGNIDSRAKFDGGYVYLKTDRPYYYPGNKVLGKMYIRGERPMNAKNVEFKFRGKEKSSFWIHTDKQHNKVQYRKQLIDVRATCFTFPQQQDLAPGDYTIPFEFVLPQNLPSSMILKNRPGYRGERPKAAVKYKLTMIVNMHDGKEMKYTQFLVVHEPPVEMKMNTLEERAFPVTTCCCMSQGHCTIKASFNKNVFLTNETAMAAIELKNVQCDLKINNLIFEVH